MMRSRLIAVVASLVIIGGCSHLRLREFFHSPNGEWNMYGGDIGRRNFAPDAISPPLRLMWEYDAGAGFSPSAAACAESTLFIGTLSGEIRAIDVTTGSEKGSFDFGSSIVGAPVIDGSRIYIALSREEEGLVAYDLDKAKTEWKLRTGDIETSPLLLVDRIVVATLRRGVWCVAKDNGAILWKFELPVTPHPPMLHSSPASDGSIVVFGSDDGTLYAIGAEDGKLRWKAATGGAILASPTIGNEKVFVGSLDKNFYAFNAADGAPFWKTPLGAAIYASQAMDGTHVYVGTAGRMFFALDRNTGAVGWRFSTNGALNSPPIVSRDIVFFGSIDRSLYAISCGSGELLWKYETSGRIKSMPLIRKQQLFVPVEDHSVLAFTPGIAP